MNHIAHERKQSPASDRHILKLMIEPLFPAGVGISESTIDGRDAILLPEEAALIAGATEPRLMEFRTARSCARQALAQLGYPQIAIPQGPHRDPIWPPGVVGSITHCQGYRAAVVARVSQFSGIGIDAEPNLQLPEDVLEMVLTERELSWANTTDDQSAWRDRLLFSAKESVFKAWFPMTRHWLEFRDVEVAVTSNENRFAAALTFEARSRFEHLPLLGDIVFSGRFLVERDLILTAVTLPPMPHLT